MNVELPTTRADAVRTGSKYYFTGKPCVHGHVYKRKVNGGCDRCFKLRNRASVKAAIKAGRISNGDAEGAPT